MNTTTEKQFRKPWLECVGSDRVSTMLRSEYWEDFRTLQKVLPVKYIRCHGLLGDELGVVRRSEWNGQKTISYNYANLDRIFDTMLDNNVRPFVEWGFMPGDLASGSQTVFWWKGNVTPPADWQEWSDLVTNLTRHWISRYGIQEVRSWPFEVWNEPNLTVFWENADQQAYFTLYECTVTAVKAVDSGILVGGPAICGGRDHWIDAFLDFIQQKNLPLDFFSRHLYTAQDPKLVTPEFCYHSLNTPETPLEELKSVRERIDRNGFAHLPLHMTEFNTSYNPLCPVHDTALNAAYLARLLSESGDWVDSLSYWTFTDLFEEQDVGRSIFHGGFGMLARYGIPKPSFHLFAFFNRLGGEIIHRDGNVLVTRRDDGSIALTAWNPVQTTEDLPLKIELDIAWAGTTALAMRQRVHENAGNAWNIWRMMGRPRYPDKAAAEFLRKAAVPAVEVAQLEPAGGNLSLSFTLRKNEITLIELSPFTDESPSYLGLDDSQIDGYTNDPGCPAALL